MPRKNISKKATKRQQPRVFDDVVLAPKHRARRLPSAWEDDVDGEVQPIFAPDAPERLYIHDDLTPYKRYYRLYQEKKTVLKSTDRPFPFLRLPAELRIKIYDYVLVSSQPLSFRPSNWLRIGFPDVSLLRTCKQIDAEGSEYYYGKNAWRFADQFGNLKAQAFLERIGPSHSKWLTHLTICTPLMGDQMYIRDPMYNHTDYEGVKTLDTLRWGGDHSKRYAHEYVPGSTWASIFDDFIHLLEGATHLAHLDMIIPLNWCQMASTHEMNYESWTSPAERLTRDDEALWTTFQAYLRTRPKLVVTITQLTKGGWWNGDNDTIRHKRHLKGYKDRLGVWDQRRVEVTRGRPWVMPDRTEVDPDEYLEYLQTLFA